MSEEEKVLAIMSAIIFTTGGGKYDTADSVRYAIELIYFVKKEPNP